MTLYSGPVKKSKMLIILLWAYIFFICWNHRLYRSYIKMTWNTLYHEMEPKELRDYIIDQKIKNTKGWNLH